MSTTNPDPLSPARHALAARLRALRTAAAISGRDLAARTGWNTAKISRIEHGHRIPTDQDIQTWCTATDSPLTAPSLIATAANLRAAVTEHRRQTRLAAHP